MTFDGERQFTAVNTKRLIFRGGLDERDNFHASNEKGLLFGKDVKSYVISVSKVEAWIIIGAILYYSPLYVIVLPDIFSLLNIYFIKVMTTNI